MEPLHYKHWPRNVPLNFTIPRTTLYYNLEVSANRYPEKTAVSFYGSRVSYGRLKSEVDALAGYLQEECNVKKGDRVILYMQNSPQFIVGCYAALRADAVAVPVNPMNLTAEVKHYVDDAGVSVAIGGLELLPRLAPLIDRSRLRRAIAANYGDYATEPTDLPVPDFIRATWPEAPVGRWVTRWEEALSANCAPRPHRAAPDDLAAMPYTSGTTGKPKGCMHTHSTLMATAALTGIWQAATSEEVLLAAVPFFHITGMQILVNMPIYLGAESVVMTRWDRDLALLLIRRHQVTNWTNIPTMVIDLFRTGDLGYCDEEGYFFIVDRLKRMINASGFKVWPAEVESMMYGHPDIQEACVIAARDPHRGETVKAIVVLKDAVKGKPTEQDIIDWCRQRMAAYKYPRIVEFADALPKTGSGKVRWRLLQEQENASRKP